jgi:hypothetical protein
MAKNNNKRKGFREYYYEEDDHRPKKKRVDESHKDEMRFKEKIRRIDPKNLSDEDFDDDYYNVG